MPVSACTSAKRKSASHSGAEQDALPSKGKPGASLFCACHVCNRYTPVALSLRTDQACWVDITGDVLNFLPSPRIPAFVGIQEVTLVESPTRKAHPADTVIPAKAVQQLYR